MHILFYIGLILGGAAAVYMYLHPCAIGYCFPNINRKLSIRPTFGRMAVYIVGRYFGYLATGFILLWISDWLGTPLLQRLIFTANIFLAIFILLFAIIYHSPELILIRYIDPTVLNWPIFLSGFISVQTFIAPYFITLLYLLLMNRKSEGLAFLTYVFIGNTIVSLPLLLNNPWQESAVFKFVLRGILLLAGLAILILNINYLLNS